MRKYFVTGIVLLLPLALTIAIVVFIVNLFTNPFVDVVRNVLGYYGLFQEGFLFLSATQVQVYFSKILILAMLFVFTVLLGVLTRWVIIHYLIRLGDYIFHRIPIVGTIYKTSQDFIKTIFGTTTKSFKQVVLAPFPNKDTYCVGLITSEEIKAFEGAGRKHLIAVFVPTTPNPTSGFLMMFEEEDLVFLDMRVEDAFKYVISCGVISTSFHTVTRKEAQELQEGKGKR